MQRVGVPAGTAHRAVALLRTWGLVDVARGRRAVVVRLPEIEPEPIPPTANVSVEPAGSTRQWEIVVRGPDGRRNPARHVSADLDHPELLRRHLLAIARIEAPDASDPREGWIGDFELEVLDPADPDRGPVRVLRW